MLIKAGTRRLFVGTWRYEPRRFSTDIMTQKLLVLTVRMSGKN